MSEKMIEHYLDQYRTWRSLQPYDPHPVEVWEVAWQSRQSEIDSLNAKVAALEGENARMWEALSCCQKAIRRARELSPFTDRYAAESVDYQLYDALKKADQALAQKED